MQAQTSWPIAAAISLRDVYLERRIKQCGANEQGGAPNAKRERGQRESEAAGLKGERAGVAMMEDDEGKGE